MEGRIENENTTKTIKSKNLYFEENHEWRQTSGKSDQEKEV